MSFASRPVLPNLLIAGVQKGGSTWLHSILSTHKDVYMTTVKELRYFNSLKRVRSQEAWEKYLGHFQGTSHYRYRGESTPDYYWVKDSSSPFSPLACGHDTATEVFKRLGREVQVVFVLRHPADRGVSAAHHHFARGRFDTHTSIWDAPVRLGIVDMGFYKGHVSAWVRILQPRQLHLLNYEDLVENPRAFVGDVAKRLGLYCESEWLDGLALDDRINSRDQVRTRYREDDQTYRGFREIDRDRLADLYTEDISYIRSVLGAHVWNAAGA